ncbi:unnamed protein product [Withania somnifera]
MADLKLAPYKWFSCTGGDGEGREYPPPIPGLAKTENVPFSQMPWVMKRYYTSDGRLIIKEEKVERFEYLEAHRTNGRLMLNLVPLNDDGLDYSDEDNGNDDDGGDVSETDGCDQPNFDRTVVEEGSESALVNGGGGAPVIGGGGSGGVKCSSLCTFGVAVPAIRPVHT